MFIKITYLLTPLNLELLFTVVAVDWPPSCFCSSNCSPCCPLPPNTAVDESLRRLFTHLVAITSPPSIISNLWLLGLSSDFTVASSISLFCFLFLFIYQQTKPIENTVFSWKVSNCDLCIYTTRKTCFMLNLSFCC